MDICQQTKHAIFIAIIISNISNNNIVVVTLTVMIVHCL